MSYWDTSCLVKLYVSEADSSSFEAHALNSPILVTSEISRFELWTTLRRKESEGQLGSGAAGALFRLFESDVSNGDIHVIPMNAALRAEFEAVVDRCHGASLPLLLRTLDAIHLASARVVGEAEIVTTDKRLREAALAEGFALHPLP